MRKTSEDNIMRMIRDLSEFTDTPGEGVTRVALTSTDYKARDYIKKEMEILGLTVRQDKAGNIFGCLQGTEPALPPIWTGSHIDSVLNGGAYDGDAGVVCGMEACRIIQARKLAHKRSIVVVVFTSEEPTRFGIGCIGSRFLAGKLTWEECNEIKDENGCSLQRILKLAESDLAEMKVPAGRVSKFVELHIEQAEQLENKAIPIGVVHTISSPTEIHVSIHGKQRHAGATPMELRADPVTAMAEMSAIIKEAAESFTEPSTVATIGKIDVFPNAPNVIADHVDFSIDIRSSNFDEKEVIVQKILDKVSEIDSRDGFHADVKILCHDCPTYSDEEILKVIRKQCEETGTAYMEMVSGAYHDSLFVAQFAPFGMIFVPSKDGISHDRNEWTSGEDLALGADVLLGTLLELSNR